MPAPTSIIPLMEGLVGTMALGQNQQDVSAWVEMCKEIMRLPANRGLTDWQFQAISDIDEDGCTQTNAAPLTTAVRLYGLLVGTIDDTAEISWVVVSDSDTLTFDGTAALANSVQAALAIPAAASTAVEEYWSVVWPKGIPLATGLTIAADGQDGANPGASEHRGWILFR